MNKAKIGVFICECGDKIAGRLDLSQLIKQVGRLPDVAWAGCVGRGCLPKGLDQMRQMIASQHLDRVVIAGCDMRSHAEYFRRALSQNIHPTLMNLMNLRDLIAQPHQSDPAGAMLKAVDQLAMAVAESAGRQPGVLRQVDILPQAVVIGGGMAGITASLALSDAAVPVVLVESRAELGGSARMQIADQETAALVQKRIAALLSLSNIKVLTHTRITGIEGPVGRYQLTLDNGQTLEAGAIIVATGAQSESLSGLPLPVSKAQKQRYAFILCDLEPGGRSACRHVCCLTALRQAIEIKQQANDSEVFIFFRELYTSAGMYDEQILATQQAGVKFVRFPAGSKPTPFNHKIDTFDELTHRKVQLVFDQIIIPKPPEPQPESSDLAKMLRLPLDQAGFMADIRVRLRPADYIERGIYVCGAAHFPNDRLRVEFEAYSAAARAAKYIKRKQMTSWAPAANIDPARCNGCGDCVKVCPFMAVSLETRPADPRALGKDRPPLAVVDSLVCTGCGNCVSVCPVKAAQVATSIDEQIEAQMAYALNKNNGSKPAERLLIFACEWSGYSAAEIAGAQHLSYPAHTRIIRLNCTGRLQPGLILKALEMGASGVLVLGCAPGVCHYEQGNEHCMAVFEQTKALARLLALDHRLKLEWVPADSGAQFVQVVKNFASELNRC